MTDTPTKEQLLAAAQQLVDAGRLDRAIQEYQKLAAAHPADVRLLLRIAELHVKQRQIPQAIALYRQVAERYTDDGFYLKAVTVYKNILRINPSLREANLGLAELYEKMGLPQDAIHQYQIVLRSFEQQGMNDKALELRRRIVGLDPAHVTNRVRLAETYQIQGNEDASLREYEILATQLKDTGTDAQRIDLYEKILTKRPQQGELLRALCTIYEQQGELRKTLQWLNAAPTVVNHDTELLQMQATLMGKLNQTESARAKWRELAALWEQQKNPQQALAALEEIWILTPEETVDVSEVAERLRPGAAALLAERAAARRAAIVAQEAAGAGGEDVGTNRVAQEEAKARERASRRAHAQQSAHPPTQDAGTLAQPEDRAAMRHRAEASVNLGDAYIQLGMRDEACAEFQKARDWFNALVTAGAGDEALHAEQQRIALYLQPETAAVPAPAVVTKPAAKSPKKKSPKA